MIIDIISEWLSSLKYNRDTDHERWSDLEAFFRGLIITIVEFAIFIIFNYSIGFGKESIFVALSMIIIKDLTANIHFSNLKNCFIFTLVYITIFSFMANKITNYPIQTIIFGILFTIIFVGKIPYKIEDGNKIDILRNYIVYYRVMLMYIIYAYSKELYWQVASITMGLVAVHLTLYDKVEKIMTYIDEKLNKVFKIDHNNKE